MPITTNDVYEERPGMNVPAVSPMAKRSQDFDALQNTLRAGNLSGAQLAFGAFLQDVQQTAQTGGASSMFAPGTQASRDLQALGGALKSANLPGAQKAFATLQHDIQIAGGAGSTLSHVRAHHPFTPSEIANNGVADIQAAAPGNAATQAIGGILNLKA
jgi:hypothetical protein